MGSFQENEVFEQEVEKTEEGIIWCDHIFMVVQSDEHKVEFKCLKCGNCITKILTDSELYSLKFQLQNMITYDEIICGNNYEYYDKLKFYIKRKLGRSIGHYEDEDNMLKLNIEFQEIFRKSLFNKYYAKLHGFDKQLIDNIRLTEKEIIGLFHTLSKENVLSSETIVESINCATPDETATLIRCKE